VDPELQKRLRPPMDVRNLVHNFHRIRARAFRTGRPQPHFIWTGVLTQEVAERMPEWLAYAKSCGVTHLNMNELALVEESAATVSIDDLDDEAFLAMTARLMEAVALAETLRLQLTVPLERINLRVERIRRRQRGEDCEEPLRARVRTFHGTTHLPTERIPEDKVGYCLAPWESFWAMPTGEVFPCCVQGMVMGQIDPEHPIESVLRNERYQEFRAALLTGRNLNETCRHCHLVQRIVSPAEARALVAAQLGLEPPDQAPRIQSAASDKPAHS
jgi:radical SAM protein with 4Fe4S-binding SPASM domain